MVKVAHPRVKKSKTSNAGASEPDATCALCPRLAAFRAENDCANPDWFNAPVPSFGPDTAQLLIIGLAPGLKGANKTGRPFTGDYAGDLLYETLLAFKFAKGRYQGRADDGLRLVDCMISNAVRCVPPQNKPTASEIATCRSFLQNRIQSLPKLRVMVALGRIAHDSTLTALGVKKSAHPFAHNAKHTLRTSSAREVLLVDSYHCSRYNTNTGRLTPDMFRAVFQTVRAELGSSHQD